MAVIEGASRRSDSIGNTTHDLYRQYGRQIYAYCYHRLRSKEEAEDAVQTTFMNAFRALQRGATTQFEQAWLFKIAQNVCIARYSSSARRLQLEAPNDFEVLQEIVPSQAGEGSLELIGVEDALEAMPENQRRAILLREWQGLSYREISDELGLSQAAVEMLIFRARRSLAGALEQPDQTREKKVGRKLGSLGSIIGALKTLLGGGAAIKAATIAAAAIAVVGESAQHTIVHHVSVHAGAAPMTSAAAVLPAGAPSTRAAIAGGMHPAAATAPATAPGSASVHAPSSGRGSVPLAMRTRRGSTTISTALHVRPDEGAHAGSPAAPSPVAPAPAATPPATVTTTAAAAAPAPATAPEPARQPEAKKSDAPASPAPTATAQSKDDSRKKTPDPVLLQTQFVTPPVVTGTTTTTTTTPAPASSDPQPAHGNDGDHGHGNGKSDPAPPAVPAPPTATPVTTVPAPTVPVAAVPTTTVPAPGADHGRGHDKQKGP